MSDTYMIPYVRKGTEYQVTLECIDQPAYGMNIEVLSEIQHVRDGGVYTNWQLSPKNFFVVHPTEQKSMKVTADYDGHVLINVKRGYGAPHRYRMRVDILSTPSEPLPEG